MRKIFYSKSTRIDIDSITPDDSLNFYLDTGLNLPNVRISKGRVNFSSCNFGEKFAEYFQIIENLFLAVNEWIPYNGKSYPTYKNVISKIDELVLYLTKNYGESFNEVQR